MVNLNILSGWQNRVNKKLCHCFLVQSTRGIAARPDPRRAKNARSG